MNGRQEKRFTNLHNASYDSVNGASSTTVSAGANTNGILIHLAHYSGFGNFGYYIQAGSNYLVREDGSGYSINDKLENIFIPAGVALTIYSEGASAHVGVWYEVL